MQYNASPTDSDLISAIASAVPDALCVTDSKGRVRLWNAGAERLFGWTAAEVVGHALPFQADVPVDELIALGDRLKYGPPLTNWVTFRRRKDHAPVLVRLSGAALQTPDGKADGCVMYYVGLAPEPHGNLHQTSGVPHADPTDHPEDVRFRFRTVPPFGFDYVSPSATRVLGHTPEEYYANSRLALNLALSEADRATVYDVTRPGGADTTPRVVQWRGPDGSDRWGEVQTTPLFDGSGRQIAIQGIVRDVTRRVIAEQALADRARNYHHLLEEANRKAQELALLDRVRAAIAREVELPVLFRTVVDAIVDTFGYSLVSIYLREGEEAVLQYQIGYNREFRRIPLTRGIAGRVLRTGVPVLLSDVSEDPEFLAAIPNLSSEVCVPLTDNGAVIGFLNVESAGEQKLDVADLQLMLALAEHISIALSRARLVAAVRESEARYRAVVESINEVIFQTDQSVRFTFLNRAWTDMSGYPVDQSLAAPFTGFIHAEDRPYVDALIEPLLNGELNQAQFEARCVTHAGGIRWLEVQAHTFFDPAGAVAGLAGTLADVTARRSFEDQLAGLAYHDSLTGLPNRALFLDRLNRALYHGSPPNLVAVLYLDLDGFKVVNDSLGHGVGDALLVAVGRRLAEAVRPEDVIARFGGDEFAVLVERMTSIGDIRALADRLHAALREPFYLQEREVTLAASIGIAPVWQGSSPTTDDVLRNADIAMYRAKGMGNGQTIVFDPGMETAAIERLELESGLHRALERKELRLYYQPIVSLASGSLVAVEALMRWQHPTRGLVPPDDFIPLAEETGLILALGDWALRQACRTVHGWRQRNPSLANLSLSVNFSAREFRSPKLAGRVAGILTETGLDPSCLRIEITESDAMVHAGDVMSTMRELRLLGVNLAIDDFGTGYSSLSYLKRFPVDTIKIDRSFVDGLGTDAEDTAIVRAVISLGQSLGLQVTAEGIETAAQFAWLRDLGCTTGQGYFIGRPEPAADIERQFAAGGTIPTAASLSPHP